jgi:hypothetical protein
MAPEAISLTVSIVALAFSALATMYAARQSRASKAQAEAGIRQAEAAEHANRMAHDASFELILRDGEWRLKNIGSGVAYHILIEPAAEGTRRRKYRASGVGINQAVILVGWEELTMDGKPGSARPGLRSQNFGARVQSRRAAMVQWLQRDGIARSTVVEYPFAPHALSAPADRPRLAR